MYIIYNIISFQKKQVKNMTNTICDKCTKTFKSKQGLLLHQRKLPDCDIKVIYKCEACNKEFSANSLLERHLTRKTPCVKKEKNKKEKNNYRPLEEELKIIETKHKFKMEEISFQKEKDLVIEEKKLERKKQVSVQTNINNIAQQINIHFPTTNIIPATYENCMEKIVNPFIARIHSGSYNSYKLVYESQLNKLEIATTIMKDIFCDEKMADCQNMIYITEQDIFMVALHKAWVRKQFDYIAAIMTETFKRCFLAIKKYIGAPIRSNFMSDKSYDRAIIKYGEIDELISIDISAQDLENISKEGLEIDDVLSGKKILKY
jgi:hypothetical protein